MAYSRAGVLLCVFVGYICGFLCHLILVSVLLLNTWHQLPQHMSKYYNGRERGGPMIAMCPV